MGRAAAEDASKKSWFGAMEMLVDGYREIARPLPSTPLTLSRTSTIEETIDIISHSAEDIPYAESTSASPRSKRLGVGRVLRLGGVFRRTGGRLKDSSISIPAKLFWKRSGTESNPRTITWLNKNGTNTEKFEEQVEGLEGVLGEITAQSNQVWVTRKFPFSFRVSLPRFLTDFYFSTNRMGN